MDSLINVGKRLVMAREACQLNKFQVAKGLGVHASTIMRWENGDRRPKQADLEVLAHIYQIEPKWFLNGAPEDSPDGTLERQERAKATLLKMQEALAAEASRSLRESHALRVDRAARHETGLYSIPVTEETRLLDAISERVRQILLAQHRLPVIREVPQEVILAVRNGIVVPSSWLVFELARHLNVYPYWLLRGEPSKEQSDKADDLRVVGSEATPDRQVDGKVEAD